MSQNYKGYILSNNRELVQLDIRTVCKPLMSGNLANKHMFCGVPECAGHVCVVMRQHNDKGRWKGELNSAAAPEQTVTSRA